jgi:hypothetical protein
MKHLLCNVISRNLGNELLKWAAVLQIRICRNVFYFTDGWFVSVHL